MLCAWVASEKDIIGLNIPVKHNPLSVQADVRIWFAKYREHKESPETIPGSQKQKGEKSKNVDTEFPSNEFELNKI